MTKKYTNGEVTIVWKPEQCIHSGICFRGLNEVFEPRRRPWITMEKSTTGRIVEQIKKCPSGALSYYLNNDEATQTVAANSETVIEPLVNGPLMVYGTVIIKDNNGTVTRKEKATALCRCGASTCKPYCDGSHKKTGFTG
jgi:uncharacterized Fe-S cluster protein YjdI